MSPALAHLAARVADNPRFLAHPLGRYQQARGLSDAQLAEALTMPAARLPYLRLYGLPRPGCWDADVTTIALAAHCDRDRLAALLCEVGVR